MNYWLQRLGMMVLLLITVSMMTFAAMSFLGDPLFNILGPIAGSDEPEHIVLQDAAREQYYLDKSLPERYVRWAGDMVTGDFGVQFGSDGQPPVSGLIKEKLPHTLQLVALAQFLSLAIAIPWGVFAASRANKASDRVSTVTAFGLVSLPSFALAVILFYFIGVKLDWLPDTYNSRDPFWGLSHDHRLIQLILPSLTLALPGAAVYQRLLRTDLITTLQEDFILMARAKGVPKNKVLFKHALRPSLFSVLTVFGITAGNLIGGSLIVESYFNIPGIGRELPTAVLREDFPVVLALVMLITFAFVVINFAVDLFYTVLDPRVRS